MNALQLVLIDKDIKLSTTINQTLKSRYKTEEIFIKTFNDSKKALTYILVNHPHIIVTETIMPHIDGIAIIEKSFIHYKPITVLISITAYKSFIIKLNIFNFMLKKPLDFTEFFETMDKAIYLAKNKMKNRAIEITNEVVDYVPIKYKEKSFLKRALLILLFDTDQMGNNNVYDKLSTGFDKGSSSIYKRFKTIRNKINLADNNMYTTTSNKELIDELLDTIKEITEEREKLG